MIFVLTSPRGVLQCIVLSYFLHYPFMESSGYVEPSTEKKGNRLLPIIMLFVVALVLGAGIGFLLTNVFVCKDAEPIEQEASTEQPDTRGIMVLIEYQDTVGLANMVNELYSRDMHALLMVTPEFVGDHCSDIREIMKHNVEIVAANVSEPFWGMSYEDQYERIGEMLEGIKNCTGEDVRIIGSRYMASDENTWKAADELGVEYVLARGTLQTRSIVIKPEEYDVKILHVSNIPSLEFMYGSMCDYSYFERAGTPSDMLAELDRALQYEKVTPVSHTRIGGLKKEWVEMWKDYFDNYEVTWQSLDEFGTVDKTMPAWQIPINQNAPYTPEKIRPVTPYEEVEDVDNPCAVTDLPNAEGGNSSDSDYVGSKLVMYHNGTGPMCLDAMEYIEDLDYPVEQHLNTETDFQENLSELKRVYGSSEGVSTDFGYYPIIFIEDRAFSGFNDDIRAEIELLLSE